MRHQRDTEFAVIGLGRFGSSLALRLTELGYSVLGIDRDKELVQQLADQLTHIAALDATDEGALAEVDIASFDTVVVAIGANFEANLLATSALKGLGVRRVIAKALSERQATILMRLGADRVILPEHEAGRRLAAELVSSTVVDQISLGPDHSVSEIRAPRSFIGRSLHDADTRLRFGVAVLAVKRGAALTISPPPQFVFEADDLLVVIGENSGVAQLCSQV
jgi:trk system potassium uptake protein TrkA